MSNRKFYVEFNQFDSELVNFWDNANVKIETLANCESCIKRMCFWGGLYFYPILGHFTISLVLNFALFFDQFQLYKSFYLQSRKKEAQ